MSVYSTFVEDDLSVCVWTGHSKELYVFPNCLQIQIQDCVPMAVTSYYFFVQREGDQAIIGSVVASHVPIGSVCCLE